MNSNSKRIVVLGTAHPHVLALAKTAAAQPGLQLVGVYEPQAAQHAAVEQALGVAPSDQLDAVLETGPALALIGAEPKDRADLAERAVAAGAAVLVDKPLALHTEALDRLMAAQRRHDRPVIVYFPYRGEALVAAAREALREGVIGELVRVYAAGPHQLHADKRPDWHWTRAGNGGALIDIGSHHIDFCCHMANATPTAVRATHVNRTQPGHPEFQDYAFAELSFADGPIGLVEVDWLNPESMKHFGDTRFTLLGTRGKIELRLGDIVEGRLYTHDTADQPLDPAGGPDMEAWTAQLITDLAEGRTPVIEQDDVWRASRVSLAAFDSAQHDGKRIEL